MLMEKPDGPQWARPLVVVAVVVVLAALAQKYDEKREPEMAAEAVANVAGGAEILTLDVLPGRFMGGTRIWCATVAREEGQVAVMIRKPRFPLFLGVEEVAPGWVTPTSFIERGILEHCRDHLAGS